MSGTREFVGTTPDTCGYHSATIRKCFVSGTREFVGTTPDTCGYHSATIRRCFVSAARVYVGTAPETYGYHSATIRSHRVSRDSSGHVPSFAALAWESGLVPASKCQPKPMPDRFSQGLVLVDICFSQDWLQMLQRMARRFVWKLFSR